MTNQKSKAMRYHDYGGPEVLRYEDIDRPVPGEGEILVQVRAVSVNPVDWKIREGMVRKRINVPLPVNTCSDLAGDVVGVGPGVTGVTVGQAVYALIGLWGAGAEHVAFKAAFAAPKPGSIDYEHAAAVPLVGLTAWQALFEHGGLQRGQRVLVHAAAGGVGSMAVQFARAAGAQVIGSASAQNADFVRGLGAAEVIDFRTDPVDRYVNSLDMVFDLVGGESSARSLPLLKTGGILVSGAPAAGPVQEEAAKSGKRAKGLQVHPDSGQLREIGALIDAGKVKVHVASVFPLAEAGKAQELNKLGHTRGKIVLRTGA